MATVKFNQTRFERQIAKAVKSIPYDRIGRTVVKRIKRVTRSGVSTVTEKRFKGLKRSTIRARKSLARFNTTHARYGSRKSNLTFSGQLVNATAFARFNKKDGAELNFFVRPTTRKPYKTKSGRPVKVKNPIDNARLAEIMADNGREFLGLDSKGLDGVIKIITSHLNREIRKLNR